MSKIARTYDLSVLIPVGRRHSDLARLHSDYSEALRALGCSFECIMIVDGPNAAAIDQIERIGDTHEPLRVVYLSRQFGLATALMGGFRMATGRMMLTLPAYDQIDPQDIGKLIEGLSGADLVISRRWPRAGGLLERLRRRVFHGVIRAVTGLAFEDLGCTARAMKREVLSELSIYGDQDRFLPLLAVRQGFRVAEIPVRQSSLDRFLGMYRPREYVHRLLDVLSVFFLVRFTKKPLRFFGMVGVTTGGLGALLLAWVVFERLVLGRGLADRPALLLSSLMVVVGLQLFALGLLGELMIFTHAKDMRDYQVERIVEKGQNVEREAG